MDTVEELREMSDEQLEATLKKACQTLFRLRLQAHTERLDVPSELRRHRRLIARIKTLQRQRELQLVSAAKAERPAAARVKKTRASTKAPKKRKSAKAGATA